MKRIAIVVQRCHRDVAGGSEALAWHYAQLLRARCDVEILTSCALDYRRWDNALPAGSEERDGITIRRLPSAWPRGNWFGELHRRLLQAHAVHVEQRGETEIPWRAQLAEQFVRAQGPWCPGLLDHLHANHAGYDAVLFCTYLYPTTYFALECVPAQKRVLIPTLHDEPPAYLAIYARAARRASEAVAAGTLEASEISAETFGNFLDTAGFPDPDLVIRTSGEMRLSNFLPWQTAYSEFVFLPCFWPDFGKADLEEAVRAYAARERRYGGVAARDVAL